MDPDNKTPGGYSLKLLSSFIGKFEAEVPSPTRSSSRSFPKNTVNYIVEDIKESVTVHRFGSNAAAPPVASLTSPYYKKHLQRIMYLP